DNAMDGGAQQSNLRDPPGPGSTEQEGVPSEWDGGEGPPEVKRSQPLLIHSSSRQPLEEPRASSLPTIPNPFPELCSPSNSPILSSPALGQGPPREGTSHVVKVFGEDGACRSLEASAGTTARQLCETLVRRTRALQDHSWALVELHQHLALERCLEDHESVVEVQSSWPPGADSRFVFRKNFAKYELFKSNASLFPEVMVSSCLEANKNMAHSELIQNFLNSGSCPEVQGFLQLREAGRKVWKRFYFSLRRSGLYYSTKGTSKDPRHLQYFADLTESNIYYVTQGKKLYGTPTEFGFCIKPYKVRSGTKGLKLLCSEDEQSRSCWMAAFRLFKVSPSLGPRGSQGDTGPQGFGEVVTCEPRGGRGGLETAVTPPHAPPGACSVFLVRESQRNPKGFVLSLCHLQRVKHYLILPSEEEGRLYFTMDDGQTRFADLIQLVEFHQINRGILPCKLRHYCTCVAL
ncbi:GRB7 protein, partial [Glaucidium brasilianum]|nr:GRB7 protein [Glaucidium brasilianum]